MTVPGTQVWVTEVPRVLWSQYLLTSTGTGSWTTGDTESTEREKQREGKSCVPAAFSDLNDSSV